jgi:hypothetical protein
MLGRVSAADSGLTSAMIPLGLAVSLPLATLVGEHAVSGIGELSLHLTIAFDWLESTPGQPGSTLSEDERRAHEKTYRLGSGLPVALDPATLEPGMGLRSAGRSKPHGGRRERSPEFLLRSRKIPVRQPAGIGTGGGP